MSALYFHFRQLLFRLAWIMLMYSLCRLIFFILYFSTFIEADKGELFSAFFYGLRFDGLVVAWSNLLFIFLSFIPAKKNIQVVLDSLIKWLYLLSNSIFIFFNCVDFAYYRYINKRSGVDIFNQAFGGQTDVILQLPDYLRDFWFAILAFTSLVFLLFYGWKISNRLQPSNTPSQQQLNLIHRIVGTTGICSLTLIGLRGGIQPIPLQLVDASRYIAPQYVSLVLNTPFTIIRSMESSRLPELQLEKNEEAFRYFQPVQQFNRKDFKNKNVVILILEGFSKEYTGISNRKSITPFLDSLMQHSLVFTNAWANGKQSIEGIPAILSSMPSFMNNPYINSAYCNNKTNSLAQLLKKTGYSTAFFHGGINGTMNFDSYSKTAGFEKYFGKKEYGNDKDFDGNWGIWDEPYLQYFASELNKQPTPFFASLFTLSSHHPYRLPDKYKNRFVNNGLEISPTIGYTDNALRLFFASAKNTTWYDNTLFVLVPDHTGISSDPFYANPIGQHSIPIIFYSPKGEFKGKSNTLVQQSDILPSILDTLGFKQPFFSFGKSAFTFKPEHFALFYDSGNFYSINDSMCFVFSNFELKRVYNYKNDSLLQVNMSGKFKDLEKNALRYFRNFTQLYHHSLNSNSTFQE